MDKSEVYTYSMARKQSQLKLFAKKLPKSFFMSNIRRILL